MYSIIFNYSACLYNYFYNSHKKNKKKQLKYVNMLFENTLFFILKNEK